MILLQLFFEFFKTGLFAVGGGLATIPFLQDIGARTGWFTNGDLTTMIAVSESTPGPMGVNMATYVGFESAGLPGAAVATLGLIAPSVIVIVIIAGFLQKFRQSKAVDAVFYGLRPASTALIAVAGLNVALSVFQSTGSSTGGAVQLNIPAILIAAAIFVGLHLKPLKKLHPIAFIGVAAVIGVVFQLLNSARHSSRSSMALNFST